MIKATDNQLAIISLLSPDRFKLDRFSEGYFIYTSVVTDSFITLHITNNEDAGYYPNDIVLYQDMSAKAILEDEKLKIEGITINI